MYGQYLPGKTSNHLRMRLAKFRPWGLPQWPLPSEVRLRELLPHLEIADADESSLGTFAFRPNIAVDILGDTDYQTQWLMVRFRDTPEAATFVNEEPIVNANPNVALVVFEQ